MLPQCFFVVNLKVYVYNASRYIYITDVIERSQHHSNYGGWNNALEVCYKDYARS